MSQERIADYLRLQAAVAAAKQDLESFCADWAVECGVKVGDVLEANGYVHRHKRFIVDSATVKQNFMKRYELVARGRVLKKDGSPGTGDGEYRMEIAR